MLRGLVRYQQTGDFHFLTFSCYRRPAYLDTAGPRQLFESALELIRRRYRFVFAGYVVMPEHAVTYGNIFEIRPTGDMSEIMKARAAAETERRTLKTVLVCRGRNRKSAGLVIPRMRESTSPRTNFQPGSKNAGTNHFHVSPFPFPESGWGSSFRWDRSECTGIPLIRP